MNFTIQRSLLVFGLFVTASLGLAFGVTKYTFAELKISGPVYSDIVNGKDLIADILPPPLYVVESYLMANEILIHPELGEKNLARITELHMQYRERIDYWSKAKLTPQLYNELTDDVLKYGDEYWAELTGSFASSVKEGRLPAAATALDDVYNAYHKHGKAIDSLVVNAADYLKSEEQRARQEDSVLGLVSDISIIGTLLIFGIGLFIFYQRALKPLTAMKSYMGVIATGDYSNEVPFIDRNDEIGEMAKSVAYFRKAAMERNSARDETEKSRIAQEQQDREVARITAIEEADRKQVISTLSEGLEQLSTGNLTWRITGNFPPQYEKLRHEFNASLQSLSATLKAITESTCAVRASSSNIGEATEDLARRTEKQASSLEEAAAAIDQITATVRTASERAGDAALLVTKTRSGAESSGEVMTNAISAMKRIEKSSTQISQIISVIDEIAFQTNLLALNAGVEAARAGDSGKGFAVVAQEVRELAQRSAKAAKEIKTLIETSSGQVGTGVDLVNKTGSALSEMKAQVSAIDDHIRSIVKASLEQSAVLSEINSSVNQMDQVTQQNSAMVEKTNAATMGLRSEAEKLDRLVAGFALPGGAAIAASVSARSASVASYRPNADRSSHGIKPTVASASSTPKPSPARALGEKITSAFRSGNSAPTDSGWDEF